MNLFSSQKISLIIALVFLTSCSTKKMELIWEEPIFMIGSQSSPRATDLNGDGVLDIVMGAGKAETKETEHGVIAVNGQTGKLLWKQSASDQIVGSATFQDITNDGVQDIFIGGRNKNLKAINGNTGELIWEYKYEYEDDPILKYARYNFYNSVLAPDLNQDGYSELLIINGGNWDAAPNSDEDRFPGVLMLINAVNGEIIAADTMPDGAESYMSPLIFSKKENEPYVIFGTGGETHGGNLYAAPLSFLIEKRLSEAKLIATEEKHGFIAPPSLADINQDGTLDIIAISHASKALALDGESYDLLWERKFPGFESSNALGVGKFTSDDIPDFCVIVSKGVWPQYSVAMQYWLDGRSGEVVYEDSTGCFSLASPAIYDIDMDGRDDAIFSANNYYCQMKFDEDHLSPDTIANQLMVISSKRGYAHKIVGSTGFKNIFSTPWIGDMDQNGFLDIVHCLYFDPGDIRKFMGMKIQRIETPISIKYKPNWGGYMGTNGNGIYLSNRKTD